MSAHPWARVKELFEGALERDGPARAAFLAEACGEDETLRREVESLVASHHEAAGFLEGAVLPAPAWEGRHVGPYRIVGEVGLGGMGTVYRAVRDDDAFQKQVAVKVVRADLATAALTERFRAERQILARLDHPNIARLFDGGSTAEGEPYLVMEYVEGRPIDVFCAERTLGTAARLRLFRTVCGAVQYAHQNLVVHRDIKPGNILVTRDAVPKLLDFGIAKLLVGDATEALTQTAFPALTPDYASPEQVRAEPVTTASDVYSLGVVLYELLTGQRPYHVRTPAPEEIVRVVCELQPEKPSTAVRRAAALTETSAPPRDPRGPVDTGRRRLAGELQGDLDTIVLKALRKEPSRRYASAQELADDVGRYLEGRPVLARPDALRYRTSKFLRRHKAAATAATLLLLSLTFGIAATAWQARIAEAHRRRAEKRFSEVRALARSFLFEIHDAIRDLEGSTRARETIVKRALEYLDRLAQDAGDDSSLLEELASSYDRVGDVQGSPRDPNLGDLSGALVSWRKADAIREKLHAGEPKNVGFTIGLARGKCRLASGLVKAGGSREALERAREARALLDGVALDGLGTDRLLGLASAWMEIGDTLRLGGDTVATIEALEKGLGLSERAHGIDPASTSTAEVMRMQIAMSDALVQVGRRQEAHDLLAGAHALAEQLSAADPRDSRRKYTLLVLTERLGDVLGDMGDFPGSLEMRKKAIGLADAQAAADPHDARSRFARFVSCYKLGIAQVLNGDWIGAVRSQDLALALARPEVAADPGNTWTRHLMAGAHAERGEALERSGALGAALESYRSALAMDQALADQDPKNAEYAESLADTKTRLARALTASGKPEEAILVLKAAEALLEPLAAAEKTNTNRRAALAKIWAGLGAAFAARAEGGFGSARREACVAFDRSALNWTEHEALAPLTVPDRPVAASVARERARCVSRGRD